MTHKQLLEDRRLVGMIELMQDVYKLARARDLSVEDQTKLMDRAFKLQGDPEVLFVWEEIKASFGHLFHFKPFWESLK